MEKDAIEYIVGLKNNPATVLMDGTSYLLDMDGTICDSAERFKRDERRREITNARPLIKTSTLQSIVDYILNDPENIFADSDWASPLIHVTSHEEVNLHAVIDAHDLRVPIIVAKAILPNIQFNIGLDLERFIIQIQAQCAHTEDKERVLQLVSKITNEASETVEDTGVSQRIEIREGVDIKTASVPNPVELAPFRTFVEVEQPRSQYILRIHDGPTAALYDANGCSWQIDAIERIRDYFRVKLGGNMSIIA